MGSEQSQPSGGGVQIDPKAVNTTDFWTLFDGELPIGGGSSRPVSLFQETATLKDDSPLDRAAKNLMIYRHPSILKFVSTYVRSGMHKVLVTERCQPLALVLNGQTDVQICLGLRTILCSLAFLVEQAGARHLNVGLSSIYVTPSGGWRLAGFEHVYKSKEVNANLLHTTQSMRIKKSVDPDETKHNGTNVEQYAFGTLCGDILKSQIDDDSMPYLSEFRKYCANDVRNKLAHKRPRLSAILQHPYFNHEFIIIHSFLTELPLKSASEKLDFFTTLIDRLREFDELNVATQLSELLLSRLVLLDPTAQLHVIPFLLSTRTDSNVQSLFTNHAFGQHIVPRILQLFCVHDAQTRLILLEYFVYYVKFIAAADLKDVLLPQLLLGIRDTNDVLVSATLRSLAELVPILGASVVIGRNRSHVFADGRPQAARETPTPISEANWMMEQRSITPVLMNGSQQNVSSNGASTHLDHVDISESFASTNRSNHAMLERLSPDGGEDEKTASDVADLENDAWSDWEADQDHGTVHYFNDNSNVVATSEDCASATDIPIVRASVEKTAAPVDIDFFADMEPVIQKTNTLHISQQVHSANVNNAISAPSRLQIQTLGANSGDEEPPGWDDDLNAWDDG